MTVTADPKASGLPNDEFWHSDWPAVELRLGRLIARRLPSGFEVADVTQHVAEVLAARQGQFPDLGRLLAYATAAAQNYVKATYTSRDRANGLVELSEPQSAEDVETTVIARLRFDCLSELFAELGEQDRFAFADPRGDEDRLEPAVRQRRSRLRRWLRAEVEKKVGGAILLPRLRWFLAPVAAGTVALPAVVPFWPLPDSPATPPPTDRATEPVPTAESPGASRGGIPLVAGAVRGSAPSREAADRSAPRRGYQQLVGARGPAGAGAEVGTSTPPPEDGPQPLLCLTGTEPIPPPCLAHPLK